MSATGQWWYCISDSTVESDDSDCKAVDRLGPYASRDEAAGALQRVADRNEQWDNDPQWNDDSSWGED